eukprot:CAMPEP_0202118220 /NCGR_PEP_ID=MMETSP0965-20130614/43038_1 /ASSEMBLY_ACC=CAM_ASM_000507 /TAXON_ID=4773 /ORGANISM="Schizochytrium aggregatum, Strain ATCC28209" /LENGTH=183 /DNA_ID=CAMNT_0048688139 /DNA_START=729 /DNA_END=1280 /DNA_ORIENTATION=-
MSGQTARTAAAAGRPAAQSPSEALRAELRAMLPGCAAAAAAAAGAAVSQGRPAGPGLLEVRGTSLVRPVSVAGRLAMARPIPFAGVRVEHVHEVVLVLLERAGARELFLLLVAVEQLIHAGILLDRAREAAEALEDAAALPGPSAAAHRGGAACSKRARAPLCATSVPLRRASSTIALDIVGD